MSVEPPAGHVALPGSERFLPEDARLLGPLGDDERVEGTVFLRVPEAAASARPGAVGAEPPRTRSYLSREELAAVFSAAPDDLAQVEGFAREVGLEVIYVDPARRAVALGGSAAAMCAAFCVRLDEYEAGGTR